MNPKVVEAVLNRAAEQCEICRRPVLHPVLHHRRLRSGGGGDTPDNLLALHDECHRYAHANPAIARQFGWIVSRYADPREVEVRPMPR